MRRRTLLLWLLFFSALLALLSEKGTAPFFLKKGAVPLFEENRAFLNASWGMSHEQVEAANRLALQPASLSKRFHEAPPAEEKRYQTWQAQDRFLDRPAVIYYTFLDGRLLAYHVFVSDADLEKLDADMRGYLTRTFGGDFSEIEEESSLKLVWQSKRRIVNYWLMEEELSLRPKYTAIFGVTTKF